MTERSPEDGRAVVVFKRNNYHAPEGRMTLSAEDILGARWILHPRRVRRDPEICGKC